MSLAPEDINNDERRKKQRNTNIYNIIVYTLFIILCTTGLYYAIQYVIHGDVADTLFPLFLFALVMLVIFGIIADVIVLIVLHETILDLINE